MAVPKSRRSLTKTRSRRKVIYNSKWNKPDLTQFRWEHIYPYFMWYSKNKASKFILNRPYVRGLLVAGLTTRWSFFSISYRGDLTPFPLHDGAHHINGRTDVIMNFFRKFYPQSEWYSSGTGRIKQWARIYEFTNYYIEGGNPSPTELTRRLRSKSRGPKEQGWLHPLRRPSNRSPEATALLRKSIIRSRMLTDLTYLAYERAKRYHTQLYLGQRQRLYFSQTLPHHTSDQLYIYRF